jgi:DNA-binding GntR family transcriptional regulator
MTATRPKKTLKCDRGMRRQAIVRSLLTEVFQGRLHAGRRLVTQELAERFGLSHTPIREALIELAGIGIIDLLPNRGAVVRRVTGRDVREMYQVRCILECAATRRACGRIKVAELEELAADLRRFMAAATVSPGRVVHEARRTDNRLHDLIADSCTNAFLAQELGRLKTLFRAFRDIAWEQRDRGAVARRLVEECREHLAVVEALLGNQPKEAARAMARHITSGGKYWSQAIVSAARPAGPNDSPRTVERNGNHRR